MSFPGFTPADFKVFRHRRLQAPHEAIKTRIRPKLEAIGARSFARRRAHRR